MLRASLLAGGVLLGVLVAERPVLAQTHAANTCPAGAPREQAQHGWQQQAQGHWVEAEACLRAATAATSDHWEQDHRVQLERSLHVLSEHVGGLQVLGGVPGARVRVDGVEVATLPMTPIRVQATSVLVEVSAEGYRTAERRVEVPHGEQAWVETIPLVRVPVAPPSVTPPVVTAPVVQVLATPVMPVLPPPAMAPTTSPARRWAWASAIGAGVFLGTGVVAYGVGSSAASTWNNDQLCLLPKAPMTRTAQCGSDYSTANAMAALAIVGFAGAGVLAVTSAVLFAVSGGSHARERVSTVFGCRAGPGTVGIACGGSF